MKVSDEHTLSLIWGYKDGGRPTSEAPTHLKCHIERLKVDSHHRLVIHCHATNVIAMTHVLDCDSNRFTEIYMKIGNREIKQSITNEQLKILAEAFKISYRKGIID